VRQIDAIFAIEREINGMPAEQRLAVRTTRIAPLVSELESWMRGEWARLFRDADVAKAMDYTVPRLNIVRTSPLGNDRIRPAGRSCTPPLRTLPLY
jgi:hypothetical protein